MKRNPIQRRALMLLASGLLITSLPPIICQHFSAPDSLRGFLTGLGLALEVIALVKIQRNRRCGKAR